MSSRPAPRNNSCLVKRLAAWSLVAVGALLCYCSYLQGASMSELQSLRKNCFARFIAERLEIDLCLPEEAQSSPCANGAATQSPELKNLNKGNHVVIKSKTSNCPNSASAEPLELKNCGVKGKCKTALEKALSQCQADLARGDSIAP